MLWECDGIQHRTLDSSDRLEEQCGPRRKRCSPYVLIEGGPYEGHVCTRVCARDRAGSDRGVAGPAAATWTGMAFAYWTAPLFDPGGTGQTDFTPEMINENGKIAPAPWVPFTRAGCDFGAVGTANTILENTAIDIPTVFGPGSPEAAEVAATPGQAFADFVGIGVHCAQGSARCSAANHSRPDLLPDEPGGGYTGFSGLFGAKYVDPAIGFTPPTDLDGNVIQDAGGHVGFPGFDGMQPTVSLAWVARMQEAGIPVTYAYISEPHYGQRTAGKA